jgi:hypothetical protein
MVQNLTSKTNTALSYKLYFDNYSVEFVVVYILTSSVPTAAYTPILTINHRGSTDREIIVAMNYSSRL